VNVQQNFTENQGIVKVLEFTTTAEVQPQPQHLFWQHENRKKDDYSAQVFVNFAIASISPDNCYSCACVRNFKFGAALEEYSNSCVSDGYDEKRNGVLKKYNRHRVRLSHGKARPLFRAAAPFVISHDSQRRYTRQPRKPG